jgi:uncharacterized protein YcfJ
MFKSAILALTITLIASVSYADGYTRKTATVVDVEPQYVYSYVPSTQEQCSQVQVPVYGQTNPSPNDVLTGAIIGGVIGNQFGGGSGKDIATALGAVIGANKAGQPRSGVVGYQTEYRCQLVTVETETRHFDHYRVTYKYKGHYYAIETNKLYEVGQRIYINE